MDRQRDALTDIASERQANPALRELIIDPAAVAVADKTEIDAWSRPDLDESKREVVRHALGTQDLLIVEGPPGTGKTTVIAEIVEQTLRRDPRARILLVSQTHIAIDNALQRLESAGIANLVRLGRPDDSRVDAATQHLLLNRQMAAWAQRIKHDAGQRIAALAAHHKLDERHLRTALLLEELASHLETIEALENRIERLSGTTSHGVMATTSAEADDPVDLQARLDDARDIRDTLLAEARTLLAGDLTLRGELTAADARSAVEALIGHAPAARALMDLLRLQGEWLQRIETDRDLMGVFLSTRSVVGGTAIGFLGHRAVRDATFDLCIFDEASKATATEALVPLTRARRWILVGDTRQLPPIDEELLRDEALMSGYQLTPELVKTTLFQYLVDRTQPPVRHLLREQYRMIQPIGDLISSCFYDDKLVSPRTDALPGYARLGKPIIWLDTGALGPRRREEGGSQDSPSVSNRTEAQIAINWLRKLDESVARGFITPRTDDPLEVLLIAPYSNQVKELRRKQAATRLEHLHVTALSVDAVQGRESDLAIFSVTRSNDRGRLGFLGPEYWRRINVALSRARYGLTIVGDAGFCRARQGALSDVLIYIDGHRTEAEVRDARDA